MGHLKSRHVKDPDSDVCHSDPLFIPFGFFMTFTQDQDVTIQCPEHGSEFEILSCTRVNICWQVQGNTCTIMGHQKQFAAKAKSSVNEASSDDLK